MHGPQLRMRRGHLDELEDVHVPAGITLTRYEPGDDDAWLALLNRNDQLRQPGRDGRPERWKQPPWRRERSDIPLETVHFARQQDRAVATACGIHHPGDEVEWELGWVAADPAVRGKGLGRLVCLATMRFLHARFGARDVFLLTDDERLPAIRTYLRLGFEPEPSSMPERRRWSRVLSQIED
jgi:RimJ/RimL family protein N-acetyltransferase